MWSGENTHHDYSKDFVEQKYKNDIVGFKGKKGTILIYNTWGVHRAKPTSNKNFVRKSFTSNAKTYRIKIIRDILLC